MVATDSQSLGVKHVHIYLICYANPCSNMSKILQLCSLLVLIKGCLSEIADEIFKCLLDQPREFILSQALHARDYHMNTHLVLVRNSIHKIRMVGVRGNSSDNQRGRRVLSQQLLRRQDAVRNRAVSQTTSPISVSDFWSYCLPINSSHLISQTG